VTIGTDELALLDLLEYSCATAATHEVRHVGRLLRSGEVVPLQRFGRIVPAAVGTRPPGLEAPGPRRELTLAMLLLSPSPFAPRAAVVVGVVRLPAGLAVDLPTVTVGPEVERIDGLGDIAPGASLALH
jgi:hypothetical protein